VLTKLQTDGIKEVLQIYGLNYIYQTRKCVDVNYNESTTNMSGKCMFDLKEIKHSILKGLILSPIFLYIYIHTHTHTHTRFYSKYTRGERFLFADTNILYRWKIKIFSIKNYIGL
jgi:hypothetical protein